MNSKGFLSRILRLRCCRQCWGSCILQSNLAIKIPKIYVHTILFGHWCCIFCVLAVRKPGSKPLLHKLPNSCTQQWTKIHSDCQVSMCQIFTTFQISKQDPLTTSEDWLTDSVHRSAFSSSSEYWWTDSVHQNLFSSKLTLNVAWEHRFKTLIVWCLALLSGRNMPPTTSDAPKCCPVWTHRMWVPDLP